MDEKKVDNHQKGIKPMFQGKMQADSKPGMCQMCMCKDSSEKANNGMPKVTRPI